MTEAPGAVHSDQHADHEHDDHHGAGSRPRLWRRLAHLGHAHADIPRDAVLSSSAQGIWALKISLAILGATSAAQLVVVAFSGSVGLLSDAIHNVADAMTALPLAVAFSLQRRPATRRYTYGYGRAEDLAGVAIVLVILGSALLAAYESYHRLLNPQPLTNTGWVMAAALLGFAGNEGVAVFRIRVGRRIGSAALVADGQHARIDGLTSLAVFVAAVLVLAGVHLADPIVGLVIAVAILGVVRSSALSMWHRLMDAVDPGLSDALLSAAAATPAVERVGDFRVRWVGHRLYAELDVVVDEDLSTGVSHAIAEDVRLRMTAVEPRLVGVQVHIDPCGHGEERRG
jgi:cation diffusion facilitator family transporter